MLLLGFVFASEHFEVARETSVLAAPDPEAVQVGRLPLGSIARATERAEGPGCADWFALDPYGYACLDGAVPTEAAPRSLPDVVRFDAPEPDEYFAYTETGEYERSTEEALTPYVYGRRFKTWKAPIYASAEAYAAGEAPQSRLRGRKFAFVEVVSTEAGDVLRREDGSVVPIDEVYLYPISRLEGRDLEHAPLDEGWTVGWAVNFESTPVYDGVRGTRIEELDYHTPLDLRPAGGDWFELSSGGFVRAADIRWYVDAPAPQGVGDEQIWVDIDRQGQTLALRRGEQLLLVTLVSTGKGEDHQTPLGLFEVQRKYATADMSGGWGTDEAYYVEEVPWTLFYYGPYALHGAYWHWGYGRTASHGCVNLAPKDAERIYQELDPVMPRGWDFVVATDDAPGSLVRVREGADAAVPDRRRSRRD